MSSVNNCNESFSYNPSAYQYKNSDARGCTNLDAVMNLTNVANVPFDNYGYLQAKTNCTNIYNPRRKTLDFTDSFPIWPLKNSKLYPTKDYTNDTFPLQPAPEMGVNGYVDVTENWPPKAIPLEPYRVKSPVPWRAIPAVSRMSLQLPTLAPSQREKVPFLKFLVQAFNKQK
jgi:hypothetical protein